MSTSMVSLAPTHVMCQRLRPDATLGTLTHNRKVPHMNPQTITCLGHTIESACFFDEDIRGWHVRCVIVGPDGQRSSPIVCADPMWLKHEREAVVAALRWGAMVVKGGEW